VEKSVAEEVQPAGIQFKFLPFRIELQAKAAEVFCNCLFRPPQFALVRAENHHIIHVPDVILYVQLLPREMVEALQVKIAEPLGGHVANREPCRHGIYDKVEQVKQFHVLKFPPQHGL